MLSLPSQSDATWKFADWLELRAIGSSRRKSTLAELLSGLDVGRDEESEDSADADAERDRLKAEVLDEIDRRINCIGASYPFRLGRRGAVLEFVAPADNVGAIYLFCLFLSHIADRSIVPADLAPEADNRVRDLVQVCCTVAAAGHVEGEASCFGWPRKDGLPFLDALKTLYKRIGEGAPHDEAPAGAPVYIKDGGIDVIAWRPAVDGMGITAYFVGQVASGKNWSEKSVKADEDTFHRFWFKSQIASPRTYGMFIPFCLEPESPVVGETPEKRIEGYLYRLTFQFGHMFYRYRIPEMAAKGLLQIEAGRFVGRAQELEDIRRWVDGYCGRLSEAAEI
jgi:hypothetical protein